jgi:hypothetical protein
MSQSTTEAETEAVITPPIEVPARRKFRFDNRYVAPLSLRRSCSSGTSRMAS